MNKTKNSAKIQRLTVSALMIALATALSMVKLFQVPQGGSVTVLSMVPLIIAVMMYGTRWGTLVCFAHGLLQLLLGLGNLRGLDALTLLGSVVLDYVLAFTLLGLAGLTRNIKNKALAAGAGAVIGVGLRFVCHFLSGWLLWSEVTASWAAVSYSLIYNGSYMLPELVLTAAASAVLWPAISRISEKNRAFR